MGQDIYKEGESMRFHLFAFDIYYPCGGLSDYKGSFDSIDEAKNHIINESRWDHYEIVVEQNRKLVVVWDNYSKEGE